MGCLDKELKLAGTAGFEYTLPGSAGTVPNGPIVGTVEIDFSLEQANPTNLQILPRPARTSYLGDSVLFIHRGSGKVLASPVTSRKHP